MGYALTPLPVFIRGSTSLQLRPRPALGAGSLFSLKVKDPVSGHAQHFVVGDILRVKAWNGTSIIDNWLRVDAQSNPGAGEGYWKYDVTRVSGTPGLIIAGTAVVNYGQSGQGFISLSSDGTIGSSPNITIGKHSGQPWLTTTILARIGNLNGAYGQATNVYGAGIGDYSGGNYLLYDGTTFSVKGGGGVTTLDVNGLAIALDTTYATARSVRFTGSGSYDYIGLFGYETAGLSGLTLYNQPAAGNNRAPNISLAAYAQATVAGQVLLSAQSGASQINLGINADSDASVPLYAYLDAPIMFGVNSTPTAQVYIYQLTVGNSVLALSSLATNDDPTEIVYQNRVATTDATVTTLHSVTIPSNTTVVIEAIISARRTGGSSGTAEDAAGYIVTAVAKGNSGTASLAASSPTTTVIGEDQAGWTATIDVTGATARVRVTGAANNNITWHVTLRTWAVSS